MLYPTTLCPGCLSKLKAPETRRYMAARSTIMDPGMLVRCLLPIRSYFVVTTYLDPLAGSPSRTVTVFDILKKQTAIHAVYNSAERGSEHVSTCQEGTCKEVLSELIAWSRANDGSYPV